MNDDFNIQWLRLLNLINVKATIFDAAQIDKTFQGCSWLLVHQNDAPEKLLLIPEGVEILQLHTRLVDQGYAYSVVSAPSESFVEELEALQDVLSDWGVISAISPIVPGH